MDKLTEVTIGEIFNKELNDFAFRLAKDYSKSGSKYKNIEKKNNNFLISNLGEEVIVYSALMRSLDSSLGNRIEQIALKVAVASGYKVSQGVSGNISSGTINVIATLLDAYKDKSNPKKPLLSDLTLIQDSVKTTVGKSKFHNSDYLVEKTKNGKKTLTLLELKIGGDLDNKKARSEKEAILEQYAILVSEYEEEIEANKVEVKIYFATAYNKDSLNSGAKNWKQASVRSFFAEEELLIGKDFWNFICDSDKGWEVIMREYKKNSPIIKQTLSEVINSF
ncbi:uncharacterized protein METZ01_LOCUS135355 [marine metagenome]|uniref:type II site-specific deoxyribonuclease n=1 Tax=marine metagenome TaxID=408172 RepID=A0A381Z0R4_9ZZZZ|tara:strand:- start:1837 stop:2673 length:837 start_codon:yes stop_codon:yes gene_type:complete